MTRAPFPCRVFFVNVLWLLKLLTLLGSLVVLLAFFVYGVLELVVWVVSNIAKVFS